MQYEEIRCRVCGSERLEKQNDGTYVCKHCRSRFCENDLEEYKKTIRSELRGAVTEALVCQRAQDVANIRRNLFEALQEEYTDSYKIVGYCRDLKKLLPNDFQANCFEALNNGGKKEVNTMLESVDEKGAGRFYVKDILEFMVKSLTPANLLPLKSLADRALNDKEKTEYLNKIEEEAGKCEAGLYSAEVPRKAFIAYSSKDMAIVTPLVEYLENAGISCFVALRNMRHGRKAVDNYDKILQRAMHNCKSFVLVSTRNSRRFDCDAIEKELPYVRDKEPNVKRIEYLVEDYRESEGAIKLTLKDFFGGSEWVRNPEDLALRIMDTKAAAAPAVKYCLSCGEENPVNVNFCGRCGKREFGTKEEYEEQKKELERLEAEQKKAARREAERKEAERKEAERRKVEQKKSEERIEATAASKDVVKAVSAASFDSPDFEIEDGILEYYRGNGGDVVIPNGVTSIGDSAFEGCSSLTSITIPNSVTSIEKGAFEGCNGLTRITIPKSVMSISHGIYSESLEEIKVEKGNPVYHSDGSCLIKTKSGELIAGCKNSRIPTDGSVTSIGEFAFADCSGLTRITIPKSVTSIGMSAFSGCSGLTSITIPNSVTSIGYGAFCGCSGLTSITIPKSVTSIGVSAVEVCIPTNCTISNSATSEEIEGNAFIGCESLEEIKVEKGNPVYHSDGNCLIETKSGELMAGCKNSRIPTDGSVTSIGWDAFCGCSGLAKVTIPKSVASIGYGAFSGCSGLTSITIPKSVTSIEKSVFEDCTNLICITIPNSVTSIGDMAFYHCSSLTRITIPKSVTSIRRSVFFGCKGLEAIKAEKGNPVYHSEGNCLIETESKILVIGCKNSRIPTDGSVTSIGYMAFRSCSGLTSITIPNSVMQIGLMSFYGCNGLTSIVIPRNVMSIGRGAFDNCREDLKIYCHDRKPLKWPEGWDVSLKDRIIWDE